MGPRRRSRTRRRPTTRLRAGHGVRLLEHQLHRRWTAARGRHRSALAGNLQSRIVEPLGLSHTFFAPDNTRSPIGGFSDSLPGGDTSGASYRALETAVGAAGSLVSTASDLAIFIRALAHGELLDERTYAEMITGLPDIGHTLGVFAADTRSPEQLGTDLSDIVRNI